nr:NnrU family protein [Aurantimonas marianensis]
MSAVVQFALAYVLFMTAHVVPAAPRVRGLAVHMLGRGAYLALYSLISILLLVWLIAAARNAPTLSLWPLTPELGAVPLVVMPLALTLVVAGLSQSNPLSVSFRDRGFDLSRPGIVAVTRHPVLWGFVLWALSHVAVNGDVVSVALFGGLALYAAAGLGLADKRAKSRLGLDRWTSLAAHTSILPFAAVLAGRARLAVDRPTLAAILVGLAFYVWFLAGGHLWLFGADPLIYLRS